MRREWCEEWGGGISLSSRLGVRGSVVNSPSGVRAEPRPPTHFCHIWGPQNTSGRENSVTLLNDVRSPESDMFRWKSTFLLRYVMKISDRRLRISDSLKISDFSNHLGVPEHPKHPQQYAYDSRVCRTDRRTDGQTDWRTDTFLTTRLPCIQCSAVKTTWT